MDPIEFNSSAEKYICEKATINRVPINGILELTPHCNMQCNMCFVQLTTSESSKLGSLKSGNEWIRMAEDMRKHGTLFVLLTGGEPLTHPDFKQIYLALKDMGMIITINTNGTLIDEEWADFFQKYPPRRINITLYGKNEESYDKLCHYPKGYDKTIYAIELLQKRNVSLKINGSITPDNYKDVDDLISVAKERNLYWKFDTYMYPASKERSHAFNSASRLTPEKAAQVRVEIMKKQYSREEFLNHVRHCQDCIENSITENNPMEIQCRAAKSSFCINWQGKMRPCVMMNNPEYPVFESDFSFSWKKMVDDMSKITMSNKCNMCDYKNICTTCAACAYWEGGAFDALPEYMCVYTKETYRLMLLEKERLDYEHEI